MELGSTVRLGAQRLAHLSSGLLQLQGLAAFAGLAQLKAKGRGGCFSRSGGMQGFSTSW